MKQKPKDPMPARADRWSDVPQEDALLYETKSDDEFLWYELSPAGHALRRVRRAINDRPYDPTLPSQVVTTTREDWSTALSVAKPNERQLLLRLAGLDRVRIIKHKG